MEQLSTCTATAEPVLSRVQEPQPVVPHTYSLHPATRETLPREAPEHRTYTAAAAQAAGEKHLHDKEDPAQAKNKIK